MNDLELKAKQEAYWARPYTARVESSHFSGTFKFYTLGAAIDYLFQQCASVKRSIAAPDRGGSWVALDCNRSYVEGPDCGKVPARYVLFLDRLQSH